MWDLRHDNRSYRALRSKGSLGSPFPLRGNKKLKGNGNTIMREWKHGAGMQNICHTRGKCLGRYQMAVEVGSLRGFIENLNRARMAVFEDNSTWVVGPRKIVDRDVSHQSPFLNFMGICVGVAHSSRNSTIGTAGGFLYLAFKAFGARTRAVRRLVILSYNPTETGTELNWSEWP